MERDLRRDLVEAASHGDHEAFEVLATSAGDRLYAVARLILRSTDLAEDAVQEALVRAWQQLPSLRDPDRFDAWLHRLVVNACADQGRQLRRWTQQVRSLPAGASISDDTKSVADREQLERGFSRLKPEHRAVVVLHYYSGFSAAEIARILGVPEGTARSRLHYATAALRAALEADARQPAVTQNRIA
ncbi:sigma-70 family RNA polymerase sigma factor [soil metagenome]